MTRLATHDWPGNLRELQNAIERAVILSQGGPLQFDLPEVRSGHTPGSARHAAAPMLTRDELKRQEWPQTVAKMKATYNIGEFSQVTGLSVLAEDREIVRSLRG